MVLNFRLGYSIFRRKKINYLVFLTTMELKPQFYIPYFHLSIFFTLASANFLNVCRCQSRILKWVGMKGRMAIPAVGGLFLAVGNVHGLVFGNQLDSLFLQSVQGFGN